METVALVNNESLDITDNTVREPIVLNVTERKMGNTVFALYAIQSEQAKESVEEKLKRMILRHISESDNN